MPNLPILLLVVDFTSVLAACGLIYYGVKMMLHMRWGKFEKSWQLLSAGAVSLAAGYGILSIEDFYPAYSYIYTSLDYVGTIFATFGVVLLLLGFREHYNIWMLKDIHPRDAGKKGSPDSEEREFHRNARQSSN